MFDRILVVGCPGSGKSTFSRRLSEDAGLPLVCLDRLFWQPGWVSVSKEEFDRRLAEELSNDRWIIDGNFDRTMAWRLSVCDAVVWLDLPRLTCLTGVLRRVAKWHGKNRPDMGDGCPEKLDLSFLAYVWRFRGRQGKRIADLLAHEKRAKVFHVTHRRELNGVLAALAEHTKEA